MRLVRITKITMYRLSKDSGVPYATINDICNGKAEIAKCTAETIYRISSAFGVSMESLIEPYLEKRVDFAVFKVILVINLKNRKTLLLLLKLWKVKQIQKDIKKKADKLFQKVGRPYSLNKGRWNCRGVRTWCL